MSKTLAQAVADHLNRAVTDVGEVQVTADPNDPTVMNIKARMFRPLDHVAMTISIEPSQREQERQALKIEVLAASLAEPWQPVRGLGALRAYRAAYPNEQHRPPEKQTVMTEPLALRSAAAFVRYCLSIYGRVPDPILRALRRR